MSIKPRIIVVTGATRGLGRALAESCAALGHTIIGCGRDKSNVEGLSQHIGKAHCLAALNVCDQAAVQAWAARSLERFGPPDLLINNAALINRNTKLWRQPPEEFDRVIDVNIKGVANVLRAFLPAMVARSQGIIVNLSSGWGRSAAREVAAYCASKFAIEGLSMSLAQELPRGMAAVALNPGVIDTDMLRESFGTSASSYPSPRTWAERAVPFLLGLTARDNGKSIDVPS